MKICVFGAASNKIDASYIADVEELGKKMVAHGHELVFGAGGSGLMGAVARGVQSGGGHVYGVIPRFFCENEVEKIFETCTELILTDTMAERKNTMENLADAFIVVPGGIGTFEEFFQVLTLKQLGRHVKPIAIYDVNGYYENMISFLNHSIQEGFVYESCKSLFIYSTDPDEILIQLETDQRLKRDVHELKNG